MTRSVSRSEHAVWKKSTLTTICESCERLLIICRRRWMFSLTCLMSRLSSAWSPLVRAWLYRSRNEGTHFSQDVVDVAVVLGEPLGELVVLLRERPDVDAAQRVRLRERESEREARPVFLD